jgi:hypothetical protein
VKAALIAAALLLAILHPWLLIAVLALELAVLAIIGAAICRALEWTPPVLARWLA